MRDVFTRKELRSGAEPFTFVVRRVAVKRRPSGFGFLPFFLGALLCLQFVLKPCLQALNLWI
jgi:hypothetical protein